MRDRSVRVRSVMLVMGVVIAACLGGAGAAAADPSGEVVTVVCDNGSTYQVTVNGNGAFTPGHDLASTTMLIPTGFGEFHGVLTDADGNVIDEFVDPPMAKGNSGNQQRATTTSCTYTITDSFQDPELGLLTFTGEGSVTGFVTPVH
jgi:hypothetical protein